MTVNENEEIQIDETEEREEEEQDLITYSITYYPADYTLKGYVDKWEAGQLLNPSFQRNYVWDQVQASKLIESFLLGIPVPGVFLYKDRNTNKLEVIDGQQRIQSAVRYFQGTFDTRPFRLKNVQERWRGRLFSELDERDRIQLEDSVLRATVIQQLEPEDNSSIYHIFERLNTGGVKLSPMEIRKCVYHGPLFNLLEELNKLPEWRDIIGVPAPDKRLRDIEFILRVLSMQSSWRAYDKPMKAFLNKYMIEHRKGGPNPGYLQSVRSSFAQGVSLLHRTLGAKPFHLRGRLNLALMDSVMTVFVHDDLASVEELPARFEALKADPEYVEVSTHSTSDKAVLLRRFELAHKYLLT